MSVEIIRPFTNPDSIRRIEKLKERIKDLPKDAQLPGLEAMEGFADWLASPITQELLVRVENRRETFWSDVDKMRPCPSCKKDDPETDKEHRAWLAGIAEGLEAVARTILSGQQPRCEHVTAEAAQ